MNELVLVIDDDDLARTGLAVDLKQGGFSVQTAESGDESLASIAEVKPDVVLLDIRLKGMDGIEVLRLIQAEYPDLPVIMVTGHGSIESSVAALRIGACDYLLKPIDAKVLVERVRKVIQQKQTQQLAEQAVRFHEKIKSLQTLAGGIAHDLNNQLTVILGSVEEALEEAGPKAQHLDCLHSIRASAKVIGGLAEKLLSYSGGGLFDVETENLSEFVREHCDLIIHRLPPELRRRAEWKIVCRSARVPVAIDSQQFETILEGIMCNALESMDESSEPIQIEVSLCRVDRALIHSSIHLLHMEPGDYGRVRFTDRGRGMSAETLRNVFDPFFSTKFTGRGMGLAAAQGIMRAHHGFMTIASREGKGTVVDCYLPLTEPVAERIQAAPRGDLEDALPTPVQRAPWGEQPARGSRSGTVLVVDDEEAIRYMARRVLEKDGYAVVDCPNGPNAVQAFEQDPDRFVLVVLDLSMPGMDGDAVLRRLRAIRPDVKILLISGYHQREVIQRFPDEHPDGFLQKPFDVGRFREKINQIRND